MRSLTSDHNAWSATLGSRPSFRPPTIVTRETAQPLVPVGSLSAPIYNLPTELLRLIIELVVKTESMYGIPTTLGGLRLVCKQWSALVLNTPELWTNISSTYPTAFNKAALSYSQSAPLYLYCPNDRIFEFLPYLERVWKLSLLVEYEVAMEVFEGRKFPMLEELHFTETQGEVEDIDLFNGQTAPPKLRTLDIRGISLRDWNAPFIFGLQHLSIQLTNAWLPYFSELLLILQSSPNLTTFCITEADAWVEAPQELPVPQTIPSLRRLKLDMKHETLYSILASIHTPNLSKISLALGGGNQLINVPGRDPVSVQDLFRDYVLPTFAQHSHSTLWFDLDINQEYTGFKCWTLSSERPTHILSELRLTCTPSQVGTLFLYIGNSMKNYAENISIRLKTASDTPFFLQEVHHVLPLLPPITHIHAEPTGPAVRATLSYLGYPTFGLPDLESLHLGSRSGSLTLGLADPEVLNLIQQRYGGAYESATKPLKELASFNIFSRYPPNNTNAFRTLRDILGEGVVVEGPPSFVMYKDSNSWFSR